MSTIRPSVGLCTELVSGEITRQSTAPLMTARYWCNLTESLVNRATDMSDKTVCSRIYSDSLVRHSRPFRAQAIVKKPVLVHDVLKPQAWSWHINNCFTFLSYIPHSPTSSFFSSSIFTTSSATRNSTLNWYACTSMTWNSQRLFA
jgi:hypothetical protein